MEHHYFSDSCSSDSDTQVSDKVLDYSDLMLDTDTTYYNLEQFSSTDKKQTKFIEKLLLYHNILEAVPENLSKFSNLKVLDISFNRVNALPEAIVDCPLTTLIARNNHLNNESFPKNFGNLTGLKELNLSGNEFPSFPMQILELTSLKVLHLGGNQISDISQDIWRLQNLQIFYMCGNNLSEVPASVGQLTNLQALILNNNKIKSLPASIANLKNLRSLLLHKNDLQTLPPEIIGLNSLSELSLRDNPLVVRFVSTISLNPPSLLEHAGRIIKLYSIPYSPIDLPMNLVEYLDSAHHCVNPRCKGVFFNNRIEHIKFVDFCGKYRIPLLQYLCSSKCIYNTSSDSDDELDPCSSSAHMMKKVLLG